LLEPAEQLAYTVTLYIRATCKSEKLWYWDVTERERHSSINRVTGKEKRNVGHMFVHLSWDNLCAYMA